MPVNSLNKRLRICHIVSGDLWAGAESQVFSSLNALVKNRQLSLQVIVLNKGKLAELLSAAGIKTTVVPESENNFFSLVWKIYKVVSAETPDIIHSHRYKESLIAAILKLALLKPILIRTTHGLSEIFYGFADIKARLYNFIDIVSGKIFFRKIIAVSEDVGQQLAKIYGTKVVTIRNGVDLDCIEQALTVVTPLEPEEVFKSSTLKITAVGRLVPIKDFATLLHAAKILLEKYRDLKLLILGSGPEEENLKQLAAELGIVSNVYFLGFRDDVLAIVAASDIFVMSSIHEGLPMALLEAMTLKKPVVATRVGGIKEVVEDGVSGFLVKAKNAQELSEALKTLIAQPQLRLKQGLRGGEIVRAKFSSAKQASDTLELYLQISHFFDVNSAQ